MNTTVAKIFRIVAVVLLGLTAAMNLLGGAGTTCAAFLTENFPSMAPILPFRWLYQLLVVLTVPLGIAGIWALVNLVRGKTKAYQQALILLVVGVVLGAVHMAASLALRGAAVPANVKLYLNVLTLVFFLIFWTPGLRKYMDFSRGGKSASNLTAGGAAAIIAGLVVLTTGIWAGPSHTYMGENWVNVLFVPLMVFGSLLTGSGLGLLGLVLWRTPQTTAQELGSELA